MGKLKNSLCVLNSSVTIKAFECTGIVNLWKLNRNFAVLFVMFLLCFSVVLKTEVLADAPNEKWQQDVEGYLKVAFASGSRQKLLKLNTTNIISLKVTCSVSSEANCKNVEDAFFRNVKGNMNFKLKLDDNPIIMVKFYDKTGSESIKKSASDEFIGGKADISDIDCEVFYRLDGSLITSASVLVSVDQPVRKLEACTIFQVAQAVGLGAIDGKGFASHWARSPHGLDGLDELGIHQFSEAFGLYEYIHMCAELRAGMSAPEVKQRLYLPDSCISKIGGMK